MLSVLVRQAVKDGRTESEGKAEAARLVAAASEVETDVMLAELDSVVRGAGRTTRPNSGALAILGRVRLLPPAL